MANVAFLILAFLTVLGAVLTVSVRNAVHAALALVGTLLSVAGLYATMNASFLGAVQVIVYAGAIMVLFLFVIMLIAFTYKDPKPLAQAAAQLQNGAPGPVGETLLTRFLLPFEAVSILLLVAVVGSVALVQRPVQQPDPVLEAEGARVREGAEVGA